MSRPSGKMLLLPAAALLAVSLPCAPSLPPSFQADSAWSYLLDQCAFGPRNPGSRGHRQVQRYIVRKLKEFGWKVTRQEFEVDDPYGSGKLALVNILARSPSRSKRRLLLAAHYDTRPWADREESDSLRSQPILGANDGASGVAVLLEMARIIASSSPSRLAVDLVFFDGEDYGKGDDLRHYLLGSKHFAANLERGYHPRWGILLDMVAGKGVKIAQEAYSLRNAPEITRVLFTRAETLGLDLFTSSPGTPVYDDHIPLLTAGIKTVDLIGFGYPQWHTLADTPENCSRDNLEQVGRLLADFVYDFPL